MNEQEITAMVAGRLDARLTDLNQQYSLKIEEINNEMPILKEEIKSLDKKIKLIPEQNWMLEFFCSPLFFVIALITVIVLMSSGLIWIAIITAVVSIFITMLLSSNPSVQAISSRQKLESNKSKVSEKLKNLESKKKLLSSELQDDKRALHTQAGYISSVLIARLQCKNFETNLAYLVLEEFNKIEARLSLGISYSEIASFFTNAKFAASQFKTSPDYNICPLLSNSIEEAMLLYEYSIEAMRNKAYSTADAWTTAVSTVELEKILKEDFGISVGTDRGNIVQAFWGLASDRVNQIQQILDKGDYMQFLNSRLNLGKN